MTDIATEKKVKYVLKASKKGNIVYYGDRNGELGFRTWLDEAILFDEEYVEDALKFVKGESFIGSNKLDDMHKKDFIVKERIECGLED